MDITKTVTLSRRETPKPEHLAKAHGKEELIEFELKYSTRRSIMKGKYPPQNQRPALTDASGPGAVIHWPTKPSPLSAAGALGLAGCDEMPDCRLCELHNSCPGYHPLVETEPPPCKVYSSYTEWQNTIKIGPS